MTPEREKQIREEAKEFCPYGHTEMLKELLEERDQFRKVLAKYEFRLKHIAENTECIGLEKCHVDGNCIHCLTKIREVISDRT